MFSSRSQARGTFRTASARRPRSRSNRLLRHADAAPFIRMLLLVFPLAFTGAPPSVCIAGGGIGGLFTAVTLRKQGYDVAVFERTREYRPFGGPIQIASNGLEAANRSIRVCTTRSSRGQLHRRRSTAEGRHLERVVRDVRPGDAGGEGGYGRRS